MHTKLPLATGSLTPLQCLIARRWRPKWTCQNRQADCIRWLRPIVTSNNHEKPYYITTPIFYVNAAPHVGHMYTMILTDVLKRWQQLKGRRAIFCTGTDEHGMKIQQAAAKADVQPKEFCDRGAEVFEDLAERIDVSHDIFIRTTDPKHKAGVEYAWQMLHDRGYIYESKHEGWYSVSDETFYPQSQVHLVVDPPTGRKMMASIETGKEVEWTSERNYHFRLSAFRQKLLDFYQQNPDFIVPRSRMSEVVRQVTASLEDLSVSRPIDRLSWGIRVPTDDSQTIYVWLDALLNYATAAGYPFMPGAETLGGWPADVQVIGKDIVRFHCIYWPAFLMALDLPLPKQILTHAHWTLGKQKMAKSTGNVVNPFFALERFGTDVMRWYLVHNGGIADDADYENSYIIDKYKKGLQGGLGGLTSRVMRSKNWSVPSAVKRFAQPERNPDHNHSPPWMECADKRTWTEYASLQTLPARVDAQMTALHPNKAAEVIIHSIHSTNSFISAMSPWLVVTKLRSAMADTTGQELYEAEKAGQSIEQMELEIERTIYLSAEALRLSGIMLQPFMPTAARRLLDMLGVTDDRRTWEWCSEGKDNSYGVPMVPLGKGDQGALFPPLISEY